MNSFERIPSSFFLFTAVFSLLALLSFILARVSYCFMCAQFPPVVRVWSTISFASKYSGKLRVCEDHEAIFGLNGMGVEACL